MKLNKHPNLRKKFGEPDVPVLVAGGMAFSEKVTLFMEGFLAGGVQKKCGLFVKL